MSRGDWLHEQLFERRIVLVSGRLDDGVAARAAAALLALDAGGSRPIELHLSSPDGELGAALVLIDTAEEIAEDMRRGRYLAAREALDYGLIDEITGDR